MWLASLTFEHPNRAARLDHRDSPDWRPTDPRILRFATLIGRGRETARAVLQEARHGDVRVEESASSPADGSGAAPIRGLRPSTLALGFVIAASMLLAFLNAFVQDDAFITFRYSQNWWLGHGPVWNPGEAVEGYTSFLWMLLMILAFPLGLDIVHFSFFVGLCCALGSLGVTYALARRVLGSRPWAITCVALLGSNYSFSAYATGGLETPLQTLLITACVYLALVCSDSDRRGPARWLGLSVVSGLAVLTRPDAALPVAIVWLYLTPIALDDAIPWRQRAQVAIQWIAPAALLLIPWLIWKWSFYGDLLPNTFYAKATDFSVQVWGIGLEFLYQFCRSYLLWPSLLVLLYAGRKLVSNREVRLLLVVAVLWLAYLVSIGGDFMEFRHIVSILPLLMVLIAFAISTLGRRAAQIVLVALIPLGSLHHALTFTDAGTEFIESVYQLRVKMEHEERGWPVIGRTLGDLFYDEASDVTLATSAAGAIPYYSRLRTIDMLGMNDKWVARNGILTSWYPGHRRAATLEYLLDRGVHLVVYHPRVSKPNSARAAVVPLAGATAFGFGRAELGLLPEDARILEIPIGPALAVYALYLKPLDRIDEVIAREALRTFEFRRE
jgi:arabinofuranosyltransferase